MYVNHPTTNVAQTDENASDTREKVVIYLPESVPTDVRQAVYKRLADEYGGYTLEDTRGGWVDDDGRLITERTTRVESIRNNDDSKQAKSVAKSTASWVAKKTDEDCVMWEIQEVQSGLEAN